MAPKFGLLGDLVASPIAYLLEFDSANSLPIESQEWLEGIHRRAVKLSSGPTS